MLTTILTVVAQATQPVVIHTTETSWRDLLDSFLKLLLSVGTLIVVYYIRPWLKAKGAELVARANVQDTQGKVNVEEAMHLLSERLKAMAGGMAALIADHKMPDLANKIVAGQLNDPAAIKAEMYGWANTLKAELVKQFDAQGVDVVASLGDAYIDGVIERAASAVSPFPGKETAVALLQGGAEAILKQGLDYVRLRNRVAPENSTPLPDAAVAAIATANPTAGTSLAPSGPAVVKTVVVPDATAVVPAVVPVPATVVRPVVPVPNAPRVTSPTGGPVTASGPVRPVRPVQRAQNG